MTERLISDQSRQEPVPAITGVAPKPRPKTWIEPTGKFRALHAGADQNYEGPVSTYDGWPLGKQTPIVGA